MITDNEIIEDLGSNTVSLRISAIESAIRYGKSARLLEALKAREEQESNPECKDLLFLAVKKLIALRSDTKKQEASDWLEIFSSQGFAKLPADKKLQAICMLNDNQRKAAADKAFNMIFANEPPVIVAQLLAIFSQYWKNEKLGRLVPLLKAKHPSVRCACVEALCDYASELILPKLPDLLLHKDSRIQLLAVKFLTRLDQFEAIPYLEMILQSQDFERKVRALRLCIFVPFDKVKNLLLDFISTETDEELLNRAGLILINNPDCEVPFRLTEIAEVTTAGKADFIRRLIRAACKNLRDSNILGDNFNDYLEKLKNWLKSREQKKLVQQWIFLFENSSEEKQQELLQQLKDSAYDIDCREILRKAMEWPIKESTSSMIGKILAIEPEIETQASRHDHINFSALDESARIRFVQLWQPSDRQGFSEFSRNFWQQPWYFPDLGAAFLKISLSFELADYIEFARTSLKSANENLQIAAINYLVKFDSDYLTPHLGKFLSRSTLKIKMAALGALQKIDRNQALSTLKAMLFQKDTAAQKAALGCMIHFDFSVVRPVLYEFLEPTRSQEIWNSALILLQANLEIDNLYCLCKLRSKAGADSQPLIQTAEKELCARLVQENFFARDDIEAMYAQFKTRIEQESTSRQNPPAYALKRVISSSESIEISNKTVLLIIAGVVILLAALAFWLSGSNAENYNSLPSGKTASEKIVEKKTFRCTLANPGVKDGYLHIIGEGGQQEIHAQYGKFNWLKPGDELELTVAITGKDRSDLKLISLERINKRSR